jgi:hypothetical protein
MVFAADDLGAWLVAMLADAGRKKLVGLVLGSDPPTLSLEGIARAVTLDGLGVTATAVPGLILTLI